MKVTTCFQKGKNTVATCEDGIVVTDNFAAVVDGSTSKSSFRMDGKTSGLMGMELVCDALRQLPPDCSVQEAVNFLTGRIRRFYDEHQLYEDAKRHGEHRLTASAVIYSCQKHEIWMVGDCLCRFNGKTYGNPKPVDKLLADIRSDILHYLLRKGHSIASLQEHDLGREWIFPCLKDQCSFQNAEDIGQWGYAVLDGFPVDISLVRILPVPVNAEFLVLASDGYPVLADTLEESEALLARQLAHDPLCIGSFRSTKGLMRGNVSFDDRSYLRVEMS